MRRILPLLLIISVALGEFDLRAGAGYSALAQKFVLFEEDTVFASNEAKLLLDGGANYKNLNANLNLSAGTANLSGRGGVRWAKRWGKGLSLATELTTALRAPFDSNDSGGYYKGGGLLRVQRKWSDTAISAKLALENKTYSEKSAYSYNYSLSKMGFDFSNPLFGADQIRIAWLFSFRFVPDSNEANYHRNNFYINWDKFWGSNFLRADIEAERKVYSTGDRWGDYWRAEGAFGSRIGLGERFALAPIISVEGYRYDWSNEIYPNREALGFEAGFERAITKTITGKLAPKLYLSHADKAVETDNFRELSLKIGTDWLEYKRIWLYSNLEAGKRVYNGEPPEEFSMFSNFTFVEGSAFAIWWIRDRIRLDLSLGYSPEWHDLKKDNHTTFYLTTNLSYELF